MSFETLSRLGWDAFFAELFSEFLKNHPGLKSNPDPQLTPARVLSENRGHYSVVTEFGVTPAELKGKLRYAAQSPRDRPAVGDWIVVRVAGAHDPVLIESLLSRRTLLARKTAGRASAEQILAANVDLAFIVSSMNADLNPRRIERYLALAWNSGAEPVLVLTKADLRSEGERASDRDLLSEFELLGVRVVESSGVTGEGVERIRSLIGAGKTAVLLGSSGVGKSTLTNALLGGDVQLVREIREHDAKGKHTTTGRHLFEIPGGGCLIDTPGMRELALADDEEGGVSQGFPEIDELLRQACRFTNCGHSNEPGCVIREALDRGEVTHERYEAYLKLQREVDYHARKADQALESAERERWKRISAQARQHMKRKRWDE